MKEAVYNDSDRQTDRQTDRVEEYNVIRALLMVLVVLGHCTYYKISTLYGGINYEILMQNAGIADTFIHKIASMLTTAIYSFHMPLFMALSGAVFSLSVNHGKYKDFAKFLKNKVHRLLLPFVFVTLLVSFPLKYLAGYWQYSDNILRDVIIGQLFLQGNSHLWFLATLFIEFFLFWLVVNKFKWHEKYLACLLVLSIIHFAGSFLAINILKYTCQFGIWFYLGMLWNENREQLNNKINFITCIFVIVFWIISLIASYYLKMPTGIIRIIHAVITYLAAVLGMIMFYSICYLAYKKNKLNRKIINMLAADSMGIYLYSDALNYSLLALFTGAFGINCFDNEYFAGGLYVTRFIATFAFGVIITRCMRIMNGKLISKVGGVNG